MTSEERKVRAQEFLRFCETADAARIAENITDDFTFESMQGESPGNDPRDARPPIDRESFLSFLPAAIGLTRNGMNLKCDLAIAEGSEVALFGTSDAVTMKDMIYRNKYCFHFTFTGDRISRFREFSDTYLVETVLRA